MTPAQPSPKTFRILVAEDNGADVFLLREALRNGDFRFELIVLEDGEKALKFIENLASANDCVIDLLVLDLNLPRRSGHEVLARLRELPLQYRIPTVIFTSSESPHDRLLSQRLGADHYISKPASLDDFMKIGAVLRDILRME